MATAYLLPIYIRLQSAVRIWSRAAIGERKADSLTPLAYDVGRAPLLRAIEQRQYPTSLQHGRCGLVCSKVKNKWVTLFFTFTHLTMKFEVNHLSGDG